MERAIARFKRYIKSRYPNSATARHYEHDLKLFDQLIDKPPRAITAEDADRFVEDQLKRGLAATTVNRRLVSVHELFEYLAEEKPEEEWPNPVNWKRHKLKKGKPLPRDISEAEVERLFEGIPHPRDEAMFRLMLDVGLRVEEVSKLRVGDLTTTSDGRTKRLRVRGKGNKERFVWLMPETQKIVEAWLEERPEVEDEAMFITRRKKGFSVRGIEERLMHYRRETGVKVSCHQLRHTFGRRMAEAEMPVTSLAALLGHEQVSTTQIYISGAGVKVQADYQAAIERLKAERQEIPLVWEEDAGGGDRETETADVWTLAEVDPQFEPAPQPRSDEGLDLSRYWRDLPDWLTSQMHENIVYQQRRWKPSQVRQHTINRLNALRCFWCWMLEEEEKIESLSELKRSHVQSFVEARLAGGVSGRTVERNLSDLKAFLNYWIDRGQSVSPGVFRVKPPKRGKPLPRFLSETDYRHLENHVLESTQAGGRDDVLDRVCFYLLSEGGLRISEVCNLELGDIDLAGRRLMIRHAKPDCDRVVPLSSNLHEALKAYLPQRGEAETNHLSIFRQRVIKKTLIGDRLRRYGRQIKLEVSTHRLRHTLATRLLNQGMPVTSIQRLLGHDRLDTTMIYARVHNETVQRDYERAYERLMPASSLAEELFGAPTRVAEPQPVAVEENCV
jgi:site-specific recombinase XerD